MPAILATAYHALVGSSGPVSRLASLIGWRASRRAGAPPTLPRWPATKMRRPPSGNISDFAGAALMLFAHRRQIGRHHLGHQFAEARLVAPAQLGPRLGRIALQEINFGGAE